MLQRKPFLDAGNTKFVLMPSKWAVRGLKLNNRQRPPKKETVLVRTPHSYVNYDTLDSISIPLGGPLDVVRFVFASTLGNILGGFD